jgi:hypothetical protein
LNPSLIRHGCDLVRSWTNIVHGIAFGSLTRGESLLSRSKKLESLWFLPGFETCHLIRVVVGARTWRLNILLFIEDIYLVGCGHIIGGSHRGWPIVLEGGLGGPGTSLGSARSGHLGGKDARCRLLRPIVIRADVVLPRARQLRLLLELSGSQLRLELHPSPSF